jgi:hypothetical protein
MNILLLLHGLGHLAFHRRFAEGALALILGWFLYL